VAVSNNRNIPSGNAPAPRILIVEDDAAVTAVLFVTLPKLGYVVAGMVSTGEAAIEHMERERPNLVMMDIRLEGRMDGIKTAQILRGKFGVPVVYMTAYTGTLAFQCALGTDPRTQLRKPFTKQDLQAAIEIALSQAEKPII
jgi:CheY-like chemotaxis protein